MRSTLIIIILITLMADVFLFVSATVRTDRRRTASFNILCFLIMVYTLGCLLEIMSTSGDAVLAALRIEAFATPAIAPLFLVTTISMFRPSVYKTRHIAYACIYGVLFFLIILFNDYHLLYYSSVEVVQSGGYLRAEVTRAPLFYINQLAFIACIIASYVILIIQYVNGPKKLRVRIKNFFAATILGVLGYIFHLAGVLPGGLNVTPIALTVVIALISVGLMRSDLRGVVVRAVDSAVDIMDDAFIVLANDASVLFCNKSAISLFPELVEIQEKGLKFEPPGWQSDYLESDSIPDSAFVIERNDTSYHYSTSARRIYSNSNRRIGIFIQIRDATNDRQAYERMEYMADTDFLTGIYNRRKIFELAHRDLEMMKRSSQKSALIMFDLDRFKDINDNYGHNVGDDVLKEVSAAVNSQLRVYDIFGRIGGEEFLIFTYSPGREGLRQFAERIRTTIENLTVKNGENSVRVTASFGAVEILPGGDWMTALDAVDTALYTAKGSGRNCVVLADEPVK